MPICLRSSLDPTPEAAAADKKEEPIFASFSEEEEEEEEEARKRRRKTDLARWRRRLQGKVVPLLVL